MITHGLPFYKEECIQGKPKPMVKRHREVWTIIGKADPNILELWQETLYTYGVIATILNVVDFQFKKEHKTR